MSKAILLAPDTEPANIEVKNLDDLQAAVGGYIESVQGPLTGIGAATYVNEEGKFQGLPTNERATALHAAYLMAGDAIQGPAVIVGIGDDGEMIDPPAEAYKQTGLEPPG